MLFNLASAGSRELLRAVRQEAAEARVIVIGVDEDDEDEIIHCAQLGVSGYFNSLRSPLRGGPFRAENGGPVAC